MNVSFEQLKSMVVFAHIVQQGSLTKAAEQLGLSRCGELSFKETRAAITAYLIKPLNAYYDLNRSG